MDQRIGYLHDEVGADYYDRIIRPEIRSATREVIGKYLPEELYSTKREAIQTEIFDRTAEALKTKNILLDKALIREVELPQKLQAAIERKLNRSRPPSNMSSNGARKQEAERQRIEAEERPLPSISSTPRSQIRS